MKTIWTGEHYRVRQHKDRNGKISYRVEMGLGMGWTLLTIKDDEHKAVTKAQNLESFKQTH